MNHRTSPFAVLSTLIFLGGASLAPAAIGWPSSARPTLNARITYEPYDGGEIEYLTLEGEGILFTTGNDVTLRLSDPVPACSILFESTRFPGATIGLSLFGRSEFLSSIEGGVWDSYLASLRLRYPFDLTVVSDRPPEETARGLPIMGAPYRELTYRFRVEEGGALHIRRECFIVMKDRLLVVTLESPEDWFDPVSQSMRSLLAGLDRRK